MTWIFEGGSFLEDQLLATELNIIDIQIEVTKKIIKDHCYVLIGG